MKKRNKRPFNKPQDEIEFTGSSNDEIDYQDKEDNILNSDEEKELLTLQESTEDSSSEEEVLGINSSSESEEDEQNMKMDDDNGINSSDIDKYTSDDDDGDEIEMKAWGKKRKNFYQSSTVTKGDTFINEEDEEAAKLEEEEAKAIQKRLAAEIDNADLSFDLLSDLIESNQISKDEILKEKEVIKIDLDKMSDSEKLNLLKSDSPELLLYVEDFQTQLIRLKDKLHPVLKARINEEIKNSPGWNFILSLYDLILTYCTNIMYYILLKSQQPSMKSHPVLQRLSDYRKMVNDAELTYLEVILPQIDQILSGQFATVPLDQQYKCNKVLSNNVKNLNKQDFKRNSSKVIETMSNDDDDEKGKEELMDEDNMEEGQQKRGITYQIAKNKGLTPYRKKELRNPRVKLRKKYRKAKIRRKGQIREVRRETKRYAGELSGINPNVCRSIQLKF